jgi:hypothetical protein
MYTGIALAIAWPETLCKQAGAWYDPPLKWLGINKGNYYKVGHAAIVLIDKSNGNCFYFDFGRYHTPAGQGRVRSALTDHDLEIDSKAIFDSENLLMNLEDILLELLHNESCHGSGDIHASYCEIHLNKALQKAKEMQENSPLSYGPFVPFGTNCSRFVSSVLIAGKLSFLQRLRLYFPLTLSPTPLGNVRSLTNYFRARKISSFRLEALDQRNVQEL